MDLLVDWSRGDEEELPGIIEAVISRTVWTQRHVCPKYQDLVLVLS
jgi:hypothetical protein